MKVVIAGGTSQIARAIMPYFISAGDELTVFARNTAPLKGYDVRLEDDFSNLTKTPCDLLLNCIGAGTPDIVSKSPFLWFSVLETFDNLAVESLRKCNSSALYIHFSSGAVYDRRSGNFAMPEDRRSFAPNRIQVSDYYSIAQLYSEAKHRACDDLRILDLRIFSFFSRYAKLDSGYFMTDLLKSMVKREKFATTSSELIRDYPHPEDLYQLIRKCADVPQINTALDMKSRQTVTKQQILDCFADKFGLEYFYNDNIAESPNGNANVYAPGISMAEKSFGIYPRWSSLETLISESSAIMEHYRC